MAIEIVDFPIKNGDFPWLSIVTLVYRRAPSREHPVLGELSGEQKPRSAATISSISTAKSPPDPLVEHHFPKTKLT